MLSINVFYYAKFAIYLIVMLSLPVMASSFIIGLLVGIFQALTQIQDQTFSFVVKLVVVMITLVGTFGWIANSLLTFTMNLYGVYK